MNTNTLKDVDLYFLSIPENARIALDKLRNTIKAIIPDAVETISYNMPTFKYKGRGLVAYAAFKEHCSFFPMSKKVIIDLKDELRDYKTAPGTIRIPYNQILPDELVKKIVLARIIEVESVLKSKKKCR